MGYLYQRCVQKMVNKNIFRPVHVTVANYHKVAFIKYLILLLGLFSQVACSDEIVLEKGTGYTVPENIVWEIDKAPIADCKVCTADLYIKGDASQVEIDGVVVNGEFTLSISNDNHAKILLYSGTEIWLGDTRHTLNIRSLPQ